MNSMDTEDKEETTPASEEKVWFPAKKYGWGWGLPCTWQGWLVAALWLVLLCAGAVALAPEHIGLYVAYAVALSLVLFGVLLLKG